MTDKAKRHSLFLPNLGTSTGPKAGDRSSQIVEQQHWYHLTCVCVCVCVLEMQILRPYLTLLIQNLHSNKALSNFFCYESISNTTTVLNIPGPYVFWS